MTKRTAKNKASDIKQGNFKTRFPLRRFFDDTREHIE